MKNVSRAYRLSAHEFKACANVCLKVYTCIFCTYLFPSTVCVRHRVCQVAVSCVRLCMCACVCVCSDNCDSCAGSVLAHRQAGGHQSSLWQQPHCCDVHKKASRTCFCVTPQWILDTSQNMDMVTMHGLVRCQRPGVSAGLTCLFCMLHCRYLNLCLPAKA